MRLLHCNPLNSISSKFDNLKLITQGKINILVITETKTDATFPLIQFAIQGYSKPYRFDRNRNGGGVFIYVREDISSRELKIHNTPEDIESIFVEVNLIKTKWLFCGCYHPPSHSEKHYINIQNIMINLCLLVLSTLKNQNHIYHNSFMYTMPRILSSKALVLKMY